MTQEEKAKRYNKALEKAKKNYDAAQNMCNGSQIGVECFKNTLINIFPELKESEDERIRKGLIKAVSRTFDGNTLFGTDVTREEALAWLEKQGEQKSADKAEPKFKVGDWIVGANSIYKITSFNDELSCYIAVTTKNEEVKIPYYFDCAQGHMCSYRLWTIQDAKEGDVLYASSFSSDCLFVFDRLDKWKFDEPNGERAVATGYCCLTLSAGNMEFGIQGPDCIEVNTVKPAAKIQRDLLFQKMKEAGYMWDEEAHKLKKIENHPIMLSDFFKAEYERGKADAINEVQKGWTEDDKNHMANILNILLMEAKNAKIEQYKSCVESDIDWLKSLRPQPKQEWSEGDDDFFNDTIAFLKDTKNALDHVDWLKSLKQRIEK